MKTTQVIYIMCGLIFIAGGILFSFVPEEKEDVPFTMMFASAVIFLFVIFNSEEE